MQEIEAFEQKIVSLKSENSSEKSVFSLFLQEVSSLLSDNFVKVEASEYEIKEKICLLMTSSKDRAKVITYIIQRNNLDCTARDVNRFYGRYRFLMPYWYTGRPVFNICDYGYTFFP